MTAKVGVTLKSLTVSMYAYANSSPAGAWTSGAGNIHLNGVVIFGRS